MQKFILLLSFLFFRIHLVTAGWLLSFSDEFEESVLNTTRWNVFYSFSPDVINQELEFYAPNAFTFVQDEENGNLRIIGQIQETVTSVGTFDYTSGLITTRHKYIQKYGYFEMRSKHPVGNGFWPAFWLDNEDGTIGEIDVVEQVMNLPNNVYTTFHCNYSDHGGIGHETTNSSYGEGYHTYGLQWLPNELHWYVDSVEIFSIVDSCIPNKPGFILANMAIGGSWPGPPTNMSLFPAYMDIDFIRAYEYTDNGGEYIDGPGWGISYQPIYVEEAMVNIGLVQAFPQTAAVDQSVQITAEIYANSTYSLDNVIIQFIFSNYTSSFGTTSTTLTIPAGTTQTASTQFMIPSDQPNGYIRVGLGVFTENWGQNILWETTVAMIGVNEVVG